METDQVTLDGAAGHSEVFLNCCCISRELYFPNREERERESPTWQGFESRKHKTLDSSTSCGDLKQMEETNRRLRFLSSSESEFDLNNSSRLRSPAPPNHQVAPLRCSGEFRVCRFSGMKSFRFSAGCSVDGAKENKRGGAWGNHCVPESHRQEVTSHGEEWKEEGGVTRELIGCGGAGLPPPPQSDFLSLVACRRTSRERLERHHWAALPTTPSANESTTNQLVDSLRRA